MVAYESRAMILPAGRIEQPREGVRHAHEGRPPGRLKPRKSSNGTAALPSVLQEFMPNSRFSPTDGVSDTDSNLVILTMGPNQA